MAYTSKISRSLMTMKTTLTRARGDGGGRQEAAEARDELDLEVEGVTLSLWVELLRSLRRTTDHSRIFHLHHGNIR